MDLYETIDEKVSERKILKMLLAEYHKIGTLVSFIIV